MKAVNFLQSAVVLALVSISEANPGRPQRPRPTVLHQTNSASEIKMEVKGDAKKGSRVAVELTDSATHDMTTELLRLLRSIPLMKIKIDGADYVMTDATITSVKVPNRVFPVRQSYSRPKGRDSSYRYLSIVVPKVEVTLESKICTGSSTSRIPCKLVYEFENILVNLDVTWGSQSKVQIYGASIHNLEPDSIEYKFSFGDHIISEKTVPKNSQEWTNVISKAKESVPNESFYNRLVKTFAQHIVSSWISKQTSLVGKDSTAKV